MEILWALQITRKKNLMSSIDALLLGILMKKSMSAYDLQKEIEYRNINKWVRVSRESIYKKALTY